jgi:hypothetical protein
LAQERTLVLIRERTYLEVLDLALLVIRTWPITLGLAAVAGIAPFAALNAWLLDRPRASPIGLIGLVTLEVPWATAPLTIVLGGLMFGTRPSALAVLGTLVRSILPMFAYQFLFRGFLMISFFFYVFVPVRLAFLDEIILLERGRWWQNVRRSATLCRERDGKLIAQWFAQLIFGLLFILTFWAGTGALGEVLLTSETTWEADWPDFVGSVRIQVGLWLAVAFFGVARFFAYIDQRIRLEGWEVERRLRQASRALEGMRRP